MNQRITILLFCFSLFFLHSAFSQQLKPTLAFDKTEHDFGTIEEKDGKATYKFEFTNTGSEPLIVNNVKASCGCTTPSWTKQPVKPGEKGFVSVAYNPRNRPGKFSKTIWVYSNAEKATTVLRIKGVVKPKPKTIEDIYPRAMNNIRLKSNHIAFGRLANTHTRTKSLDIINTSKGDITLGFENVPEHIEIKAVPETLKPEQKGQIVATYNGTKKNDWGFVMDAVYVLQNGTKDRNSRLSISANIIEDFSELTAEQLNNAPKAEFDNKHYNFGTVETGEIVKHDFVLKNTGKNDLHIRKTRASCGCTVATLDKEVIKPGESSKISIKFNTKGRTGSQRKTVTVITNDPRNPTSVLEVKGVTK